MPITGNQKIFPYALLLINFSLRKGEEKSFNSNHCNRKLGNKQVFSDIAREKGEQIKNAL